MISLNTNLPIKLHYHMGTFTFLWDRGRLLYLNLFTGDCSVPHECGWELGCSLSQKPPNLALGFGSRARSRVPSYR